MKQKTGIIILAAGASQRLGQPKQQLLFKGKSLLTSVVDEALKASTAAVVVVTGANDALMLPALNRPGVLLASNPEWKTGLASSIRTGLTALIEKFPTIDNCILSVCDQPHLNAAHFEALIKKREDTSGEIVASSYAGTVGVPALFSASYFSELRQLSGDEGAKSVIRKYGQDVEVVDFEAGAVDIDTVDDYQRLISQMVSVAEAKQMIADHPLVRNSKRMPVADAVGFVLAQDVIASANIPAFLQSSMDGYAIRFEERNGPLEVVGEMVAGASVQLSIGEGQATRIFTGAPLPAGADTVIMQERVSRVEGKLICDDERLTKGANVRQIGAEIGEGQLGISSGTYLSAAAIGFLSGIGCSHADVWIAPRVAIVLTGDELQSPGSLLHFGQVYESNSAQLGGALRKAGVSSVDLYHAVDNPLVLREKLEEALSKNDVIMLVGGVSVGDYDFVTRVVGECGVIRQFHKVKQKPGKPLFFGTRGKQQVFGLPGNPSSALTCFYEYVLPALAQAMGYPQPLQVLSAKATHSYQKPGGLTHFLKAHYDQGRVTPLHAQESFRLQSFAQANCFLVLDEKSEGCKAGDEVEVHLIPL